MDLRIWGLLAVVGCAASEPETPVARTAGDFDLLDDSGRPLGEQPLEVGEDLGITVRDLRPDTDHTLVVIDDESGPLFTLVAPSDASGSLDRLLLWPDVGLGDDAESEWFATRELAAAHERLGGRKLRVTIEIEGKVLRERSFEVARELAKPRVFAVDERDQITRAATGKSLTIAARNLPPGLVDVTLVADRTQWLEGDELSPALSREGKPLSWRTEVGERGELAIPIDPQVLPPGGYQIAVHPPVKPGTILRLDPRWKLAKPYAPAVIGPSSDEPYWPGSSIRFADVSTRATTTAPYFIREDVFHTGEPVWATFHPPLPAGTHVASLARKVRFYVVPHRTATEWRTNAPLVDVSGHVVEAIVTLGGTTGNRALIGSALAPGRYDIVVDTGNRARNPSGFVADGRFDAGDDFVDGITRVGFTIVDDPNATGPHAVGSTRYTAASVTYEQTVFPDIPPSITARVAAEVRYPASIAGEETAMVNGTFPIVVIAHGNTLVPWGHNDLLAHLASHGYIAVAIDLEDLSWSEPPIDLRARLILEHIDLLSNPSRQPAVLQGHVDTSNIAIAGHSRGGDAALRVAHMAKRDGLAVQLRAIASIAPTDVSGAGLRDRDPSVIDVPYFALHGSLDNDVGRGFGFPFAAWDRGGLAFRAYDRNVGVKSMLFIEDVCHNLFNEERMVCEGLGRPLVEGVSRAEHLMLLRGYLTAFFAWHVHGDDLQRVFFESARLRGGTSVVHHQFHDPRARVVDNFEDARQSTNWTGGRNIAFGFDEVADEPLGALDASAPHTSGGRLLRWTTRGAEQWFEVTGTIDATANPDAAVSLRVSQAVGLLGDVGGGPSDIATLDAGQLTQGLLEWMQDRGTDGSGASVVVEVPGARWTIENGTQRLLLTTVSSFLPTVSIRNANIAETRHALPIRIRLRDATGATRAIGAIVPAPIVKVFTADYPFMDIDRRQLAALETIRIPIAAFAIPDASGPGIDPTQITEVAIELESDRGELLVDDVEIGP
jgi:dienelactone hydrolase